MKRTIIAALFAATGTFAHSAEVAPANVKFDDSGAVDQSLTGVAGDAAMGMKIVSTKKMGNCVACHQISSLTNVSFQGNVGPTLDGVGSRYTAAELRGIVANAKHTFPGTVMPSFYKTSGYIRPGNGFTGKAGKEPLPPLLKGQQVEDVVAYLQTLK